VKELSEAIKSGSDQKTLFVKKQVAKDVKRLTTTTHIGTEPVESANIIFHKTEHSLAQFGMILYNDAAHSGAPSHIPVGKEYKVSIAAKHGDGDHCTKRKQNICTSTTNNRRCQCSTS